MAKKQSPKPWLERERKAKGITNPRQDPDRELLVRLHVPAFHATHIDGFHVSNATHQSVEVFVYPHP